MKILPANTNYALLAIQLLIIILLITFLIIGIINLQDYFDFTGDYHGISSIYDTSISHGYFRPALILLIPTIGIFIKKKVGWILITSYFYFVLTNILFSFILHDDYNDYIIILSVMGIITLIVFIVIIMNTKKISLTKYNIQRSVLILYNIAAFIIGVAITIYLAFTSL